MLLLNIPNPWTIGDTFDWVSQLDDYPNDQYVLKWSIRGVSSLDLIAVPAGSLYKTSLITMQSIALLPGLHFYQAYVENLGNERLMIGSGQIEFIENLATAREYDGRSPAQKNLEAVEQAIQAHLEGGAVVNYSINGRSLSRTPLTELIKLRAQLKIEVSRERAADKIAQGLGDPRKLFVRFR